MKYKDVTKEQAKKCCKEHCKRINGKVIPQCENCPLERPKKFCAFMLLSLHENYKECPLLNEEYDALMNEDITKSKEWEEWLNKQESQE